MWVWSQGGGTLSKDGKERAKGYAGKGLGKNNPLMESVKNTGPIPKGMWRIEAPVDTEENGPYVLRLTPFAETDTKGRGGFLIHGDSKAHPGEASRGCIILGRKVREEIWTSGDHSLEVVT